MCPICVLIELWFLCVVVFFFSRRTRGGKVFIPHDLLLLGALNKGEHLGAAVAD